ncbi:hypothetical protein [Flavisolibacter tropicus]|uniref:YfhD family protein n=1 Tax=Flavisolibacter tropicus TaxID=1492898 RepID=A0A172TRU0_9BACT|nr:hypothetical protein [Flavisolibacter tropicus]ANE49791.1 hypothetical protein SY85_04065 [Flavisolibacter tropicus]
MNKNNNKQSVNVNSPAETRDDSTAPTDPKVRQQKEPREGGIRRVEKRSTDAARFDDDYEAAQEDAISKDNKRSEDEKKS